MKTPMLIELQAYKTLRFWNV